MFALCTLKTRVYRQQNDCLRLDLQPKPEVAVARQSLARGGDQMMNKNVEQDIWKALTLCRRYCSAHFDEQQAQVVAADGTMRCT